MNLYRLFIINNDENSSLFKPLGREPFSAEMLWYLQPEPESLRKCHSNMWPHALALFLESKQLNGDAAPGVFGGQRAHRCYPFMCQVLLGGGLMRKMGIGFKLTKKIKREVCMLE